jgi:hypothetical protein
LPRDSARIYGRGRPPHEVEQRERVLVDQRNARRAVLRAVVEGKVKLHAIGLPAEPAARKGLARSDGPCREAPTASASVGHFEAVLREGRLSMADVRRGERLSPYIFELFGRAAEIETSATGGWESLSLRAIAERELFDGEGLLVFGTSPEERIRSLYEAAARKLANSINQRCYDFMHGLPLYESDGPGHLKRLTEDRGIGANIAFMVRHNKESSRCLEMDKWVSAVHVRASDQDAFDLFFSDGGFAGQSERVRRRALQLFLDDKLFDDATTDKSSAELVELRATIERVSRELEETTDKSIDLRDFDRADRAGNRIAAILDAWKCAIGAKDADGRPNEPRVIVDRKVQEKLDGSGKRAPGRQGRPPLVREWLTDWFETKYVKEIEAGKLFGLSVKSLVKVCNWDVTGGQTAADDDD